MDTFVLNLQETPTFDPRNTDNTMFYEQHKSQFKTGDVILYDGVGFYDSLTKVGAIVVA